MSVHEYVIMSGWPGISADIPDVGLSHDDSVVKKNSGFSTSGILIKVCSTVCQIML